MKNIVITGARGFLGRNLAAHLAPREDVNLSLFDLENTEDEFRDWVANADVIFHLAGVNRPQNAEEFETGNAGLCQTLADAVRDSGRKMHIIVSSSIQAALDNPYGQSKRHGEEILAELARETGTRVSIFRLKNIFGKWCRPNYNSVTATFCHNIANDLPIQISDPSRTVDLVYVDDVVRAMLAEMEEGQRSDGEDIFVAEDRIPSYSLTLGDLAGRIEFFRAMHESLQIPDFSVPFNHQLYATYLSYVPVERWEYGTKIHTDQRGNLAELVKSPHFGQIFVSRTKPGVTRGNHYHHTKTEKFIVIAGEGLIRFRHIDEREVIEIPVRGEDYRIVDIPPGYTHSITNIGDTEMITLFWASEPFNPDRPDTYFLGVDATAEVRSQKSEGRGAGRGK
jgi:UDP-2-acetamido-2,6-beta-L-arabino-hexul-4-ose reductase